MKRNEIFVALVAKAAELKQRFNVRFKDKVNFNLTFTKIVFIAPISNEFVIFIAKLNLDWELLPELAVFVGQNVPSRLQVRLPYNKVKNEETSQ